MTYEKQIAAALKACPLEKQAMADAINKADELNAERTRIGAAIERLQAEPDQVESRVIGGVTLQVPSSNRRNDVAALARRRDELPRLAQAASHEIEKVKKQLSRAVAAKLTDITSELQRKTLDLLESATELCKQGDELERAMELAGLDADSVYAVRYECLQSLRTDRYGDGSDIAGRLREVA
ncbi:MAG: hypothetical protein FJW36_23910 [Acidobacteria bacterium]|nr:hypothetical protein [Acidobacteriota bacterium]